MVKLASARDARVYGPRGSRNRGEYINAGLYLFATVVLLGGFVALFSREAKSSLVVLMMALLLILAANVHDLVAHLAAYDYRLGLMEYDLQLVLVEFAVPLLQALGSLLSFLGILFLFIQEEKGYGYSKLEKHTLNMLIAGPVLWLIGSIYNSCQIYERADSHLQILQQSVHIPFLMASVLFMTAAILNRREQAGVDHHGLELVGMTWIWLGIFGSLCLVFGGFMNVVKVFKMQQVDGLRLEKLRGGAPERLIQAREGQIPFLLENHRRRRQSAEEEVKVLPASTTPYKDVLVGQSQP
ncbi:hypothetical protein L484_011453 [Morus notabilis]|uniref:Uncharacterized protein n=1 Tax=Morus notabilis TaxID=981085 RepID=W9R5I3_9ROSA|nr:uncharacterized protein LOC21394707 [Morus notabilis]EXB72451.1 hypothetical protein L484_011453 [Morus notabilis]